jgi:hypothetical protein
LVLISEVVRVSWSKSLQIDNVRTLISSSYTFNIDRSSDFDFFVIPIKNLVAFNIQIFAYFLHQLVEFFISMNGLLLIYCPVLSQTGKIVVMEDSWDDGLGNDSVTSVVDEAGGQDVEAFDVHQLQDSQAVDVVIGLSEAGVVIDLSKVLEGEGLVDSE